MTEPPQPDSLTRPRGCVALVALVAIAVGVALLFSVTSCDPTLSLWSLACTAPSCLLCVIALRGPRSALQLVLALLGAALLVLSGLAVYSRFVAIDDPPDSACLR